MRTIKKYSNRRLYDTGASSYITLDELAGLIRDGHDVTIIDAKTSEDLTQGTLAQIVIESRGAAKLLPADLLLKLIRMENDALAEFMTNYVTWALDIYLIARDGMRGLKPTAKSENALMKLMSINPFFRAMQKSGGPTPPPPSVAPEPEPEPPADSDVETLRKEVGELKEMLKELASKG